jgi:hypothetical protein
MNKDIIRRKLEEKGHSNPEKGAKGINNDQLDTSIVTKFLTEYISNELKAAERPGTYPLYEKGLRDALRMVQMGQPVGAFLRSVGSMLGIGIFTAFDMKEAFNRYVRRTGRWATDEEFREIKRMIR